MPDFGPSRSVKAVEVLRPGTFNGIPISRRDLEDIVEAFKATSDRLPVSVRLGHSAKQAFAKAIFGSEGEAAAADHQGWPAMGWATDLYLKGDILVADLADVPGRLVEWIRDKRYRTRSGALRYNREVDGTVYRWLLDHVALLGAETPAIDGLADIDLSEVSNQEVLAHFAVSDEDGLLELRVGGPHTRDEWLTQLQQAYDEGAPLFVARRGAVRARHLFAAAISQLRATAREEIPLSQENPSMQFSLNAIRGSLGLDEDADLTAALTSASQGAINGIVELAEMGGMSFKSPEQLVGWLSGAMGLSPGDLDGIAAGVVEAMGGKIEEPTPADADPAASPTPDPMAPGDENNMSYKPKATPAMVELSQNYLKLASENAELKSWQRARDAETEIDAALRELGVEIPRPVRDTLVQMSAQGNESWRALLPSIRPIPTKEQGTTETPEDTVELSASDRMVAKRFGMSEEAFLAQKQADESRYLVDA